MCRYVCQVINFFKGLYLIGTEVIILCSNCLQLVKFNDILNFVKESKRSQNVIEYNNYKIQSFLDCQDVHNFRSLKHRTKGYHVAFYPVHLCHFIMYLPYVFLLFQSECDIAAQQRATVRNVILQKYFDLLPRVQQDLAMRRNAPERKKTTQHIEGSIYKVHADTL